MRLATVMLLVLLLTACGGNSTGGGDTSPDLNPGPDVALILCNGHSFGTVDNYLALSTGPFLESALQSAGYSVETSYFTDDITDYTKLVAKLQAIFDDWIDGRADATRIVIVPHSHGAVRAHAAIRAKPQVPIRLLADLDASSNGWALTHPGEDATLGGSPVDAHTIVGAAGCPQFPLVPDEAGDLFDVEDVVFDSVEEAYEVRTGDIVPNPFQFEMYDERWNARLDGSSRGLTCWFSDTGHSEPTLPTGATLPRVRDWILERLASDSP